MGFITPTDTVRCHSNGVQICMSFKIGASHNLHSSSKTDYMYVCYRETRKQAVLKQEFDKTLTYLQSIRPVRYYNDIVYRND